METSHRTTGRLRHCLFEHALHCIASLLSVNWTSSTRCLLPCGALLLQHWQQCKWLAQWLSSATAL